MCLSVDILLYRQIATFFIFFSVFFVDLCEFGLFSSPLQFYPHLNETQFELFSFFYVVFFFILSLVKLCECECFSSSSLSSNSFRFQSESFQSTTRKFCGKSKQNKKKYEIFLRRRDLLIWASSRFLHTKRKT